MRILLVEDDDRIVHFVRQGLQAEGYGVDVAQDGQAALDRRRSHYQLIILDLLLPKTSDLEVCRALRRERIQTPILILSAKNSLQEKVDGLQAGADDYMTKPFAFEELIARIKALVRRGPYEEIPPTLKVADLTLNQETREVRRGTKALSLTAKEYALLGYLMSRPNRPISRTVILDQVWGYHTDTLTNVVDVYIGYLRKKVDNGSRKKLIKTERNVGYMIVG